MIFRLPLGFEDRAHGAMLVVTELSAQSYAKVAQDFAPEQMQAGGIEVVVREKIPLSGGEGLLVVARNRPNLRVVTAEQIRIGGVPGHQIVAASKDDRTGDDLVLVQWLRFGGGVVQMFGIARRDQWDAVLPRMRAVRDGFGGK